jgi:hypothetical protein
VPDGCTDVVWRQGEGTTVAGQDTTAKLVDCAPRDVLVGIRFLPGAGGGAPGVPLGALRDLSVAVAEVDRAFDVDGDLAPGDAGCWPAAAEVHPRPERCGSRATSGLSVSFKTPGCGPSRMGRMKVGIGLPAAVPETDMRLIGVWAAEAERAGFESVGVIDRLIYDNLDPLTALAAAAVRTTHIELISTVVNVCWRNNPLLLAKQLSSVAQLSGGRLTAGLGMGGWPADYDASVFHSPAGAPVSTPRPPRSRAR